jgi:hypothetical protein
LTPLASVASRGAAIFSFNGRVPATPSPISCISALVGQHLPWAVLIRRRTHFFIQDDWRISALTLNLGVRYD